MIERQVREEVVDELVRLHSSPDRTVWASAALRLRFNPPPNNAEVEQARERLMRDGAHQALRRLMQNFGVRDDDL